MSTSWLYATVTISRLGLLCLLLAAGSAVAFLGYQTLRCRRWHADVRDDDFTAWDDQPPATETEPAEGGRDTERAAS